MSGCEDIVLWTSVGTTSLVPANSDEYAWNQDRIFIGHSVLLSCFTSLNGRQKLYEQGNDFY